MKAGNLPEVKKGILNRFAPSDKELKLCETLAKMKFDPNLPVNIIVDTGASASFLLAAGKVLRHRRLPTHAANVKIDSSHRGDYPKESYNK